MLKLIRGRCLLKSKITLAKTTQSQLSRKIGYSPAQITNWIKEREKIPYEAAVLIAYVLECHAEDLYEWTIE
ncbi:helix-turn-helix transcriptional regulator [Paenibacillus polymyxa]|uniref:helix-turn-helix domain-containing protein n=1 Tax=Paenibacillus polymyxa TaxID=1406 RepID=UPI000ED59798|nr:helix-turn-helix transcriptional regulator [Paenibacillus polymyxa]RGL32319.1 XRE family transcriptional regulator [Paenibacillus polymyxa]WHX37445.1 helix-turn-helix transcriptional regulator [Paenibacillus polymyxa]